MEQAHTRSGALEQLVDQLDAAEAVGVLAQAREVLAQANDLLAAVRVVTPAVEKRGRGRPKKWLSAQDVAEELERNHQVVRRWMKQGKIPAHMIGGEYRISRQEFEEWLEEQRLHPLR